MDGKNVHVRKFGNGGNAKNAFRVQTGGGKLVFKKYIHFLKI